MTKSITQFIVLFLAITFGCKSRTFNPDSHTQSLKIQNKGGNKSLSTQWSLWQKEGRTVVLLDTIHLGPSSYYDRLEKILGQLHEEFAGKRVAVAMEGVGCSGKMWVITGPKSLDVTGWAGWQMGHPFHVPPLFPQQLSQWQAAGAISQVVCGSPEMAQSKKALDYCDTVKGDSKWTCQSVALQYPKMWDLFSVDDDLSLWPPHHQIALGLSLNANKVLTTNAKVRAWWREPLNPHDPQPPQVSREDLFWASLAQQQRSNSAWERAQVAFKRGFEVLVFPWGADHYTDFVDILVNEKFVKMKEEDVFFNDCSLVEALIHRRGFMPIYLTRCFVNKK